MGTYYSYGTSHMTAKEFLMQELNSERHQILDLSIKGSVAYMAVRVAPDNQPPYVYGLVCHLYRDKGDWGYKPVEESMGPHDYDCPLRILNRLSPTTEEYALKWREACRERHQKQSSKPRPKPGMVLQFAHPIKFTDGHTGSRFTVEAYQHRGRAINAFRAENGRLYRINGLNRMQYQAVS